MHHATWIDLDSLFNCVMHLWPVYFVSYSVACIFLLFCGQRLFYAQSQSDDGHAANVETDPAPSNEELYDSHLPASVVCSIYSFHDRARGCLSFSSAATFQLLNCTLILDIYCWYLMYSLRLAPQWFTFT